ncbi:adenylyl cyclase [Actinoplanes cyaneus]|uniref:adenylyl cyclase n=1 Tax=Actinoplanes cyaneus TaxID=52696 RepID=UPI001EF2483B|nr:adenylyl cyclase [Actinoplanes cyaneus]
MIILSGAFVAMIAAGAFAGPAPAARAGTTPDFGPNVKIFDPSVPVADINAYLQSISAEPEFGTGRHAVYFKPGVYGSAAGQNTPSTATGIVNSEVGYYTSIAGLGSSPADVRINGALHSEPRQNADGSSDGLTNFYRSLANLSINPIQRPVGADAQRARPEGVAAAHTMRWATSQASSLRRVDIQGDLDLNGAYGATLFGAEIADSRVSGTVHSGGDTGPGQAQYYVRDSQIGGWSGGSANLVFSGVRGAPAGDLTGRGITTLAATPVSRPAPFLTSRGDNYSVFVPKARINASGVNWATGSTAGTSIPISRFHIAKPGTDTAATINTALAAGKHLILTPGVYRLSEPIRVTRAGTVVMGMGYATLAPAGGQSAIEVGDVKGVVVAGLVVDAGIGGTVLVRVGTGNATAIGDATDPTTLSDLFVRVGGARPGSATIALRIDQSRVVLDDTWLWRADHGAGVGWTSNTSDTGLVVNGAEVTALGLFAEHHQKNQVVWNGERGRTVFYQSEFPYDPPNQAAWMDGVREGYASYKVTPGVTTHAVTGTAIYTLFTDSTFAGAPVHAWTAIEAPTRGSVRLTSMTTAVIALGGGIRHVVGDSGAAVDAARPNQVVPGFAASARLASFPS